jgi:hypothetical protein
MKNESAQTNPGLNRRMLLRGGLATGLGVAMVGVASTALGGVSQAATAPGASRRLMKPGATPDGLSANVQDNWAYCANCAGLWFTNDGSVGVCPAKAGGHIHKPSDDYAMIYNVSGATGNPLNPQPEWSWCLKCQGLFFGPNVTLSWCPDGGHHNRGTWNYSMWFGSSSVNQPGWYHCTNCQGLFYGGQYRAAGICPQTGTAHQGAGSDAYNLGYT